MQYEQFPHTSQYVSRSSMMDSPKLASPKRNRNSIIRRNSSRKDINDSESKVDSSARPKFQKIEIRPTILLFKFLDGREQSHSLIENPKTYGELQQCIAKIFPKNKSMFMISDVNTRFVTSDNFKCGFHFVIKEFFSPQTNDLHPLAPIKWDFVEYHARVKNWVV